MRKKPVFETDYYSIIEKFKREENHIPKSVNELPKISEIFEYRGKQCVIVDNLRFFCAYVETKIKNPSYHHEIEMISANRFIDAHGGVTYAGELDKFHQLKDKFFFGIDFGHSGDHIEFPRSGCPNCTTKQKCKKWERAEIIIECKKLADGVIKYEKLLPHFLRALEQFEKDVNWTIENYGK